MSTEDSGIIKGLEKHGPKPVGTIWHCSEGTYEVVSIDEETGLPNYKALPPKMSTEDRIKQAIEQLDAKIEALMLINKLTLSGHGYAIPMIKFLRKRLIEFIDGTEGVNDFKEYFSYGGRLLSSILYGLTEAFAVLAQEGERDDQLVDVRDAIILPLFNFLIENGARF